ncbi:MAG: hypothetical protein WCJ85_09445 [Chitinophagaceae bacterium]
MIEQTVMTVIQWDYQEPAQPLTEEGLTGSISFDVMKKRNEIKKGLGVRFNCEFSFEKKAVLDYVAEHSYVIDFEDVIDLTELRNMIQNSYLQFKEKYDLRKLNTVLKDIPLQAFDERMYDLAPILGLLNDE